MRKFRKYQIVKKSLLSFIFLFSLLPKPSVSQEAGMGVAEAASNMVDKFTGNLQYSIPLMTIPNPHGAPYTININYASDIRVEQGASWVGLGWDLNPGEIRRTVKGVPDDWKGKMVRTYQIKPTGGGSTSKTLKEEIKYYGPIYYKDFDYADANSAMDIYQTSRNMTDEFGEFYFEFPDYDKYYISGPGIGGEIEPHLFEYATLVHKSQGDFTFHSPRSSSHPEHAAIFTKRPQFMFSDEFPARIDAPYTGGLFQNENPAVGMSSPVMLQAAIRAGLRKDYEGNYSGGTINRMHTAKYIEYYTNEEINTQYNTLKNKGFLDYRIITTGDRRPSAEFDPDGIGAFKITNESGITYHYSLPVYSGAESQTTFGLADDFSVREDSTVNTYEQFEKYANAWKLTAVTGPDYRDANNDGMANLGDEGYWVSFNYGLWVDEFGWRFPFYEYKFDVLKRNAPERFLKYAIGNDTYYKQGLFNEGRMQTYYLNTIQTQSHTAYFIKNLRMDEHSKPKDKALPTPKLRLEKIILLSNKDLVHFNQPRRSALSLTGFSMTGADPKGEIVDINIYNANKKNIDSVSLKTVEFAYDYHLAESYHANINTQFTLGTINYHDRILYEFPRSQAVSHSNSGKLTLLKIQSYERGHKQMLPSYLIDYTSNNPAYNPNAVDFWGFHKQDYNHHRSAYTTDLSKDYVDAWSLSQITTPSGLSYKIRYESDNYQRVGYQGNSSQLGFPVKTFRIINGNRNLEFQIDDPALLSYISDSPVQPTLNFFITAAMTTGTGVECEKCINKLGYFSFSTAQYTMDKLTNTIYAQPNLKVVHCGTSLRCEVTIDRYLGRGYVSLTQHVAFGGGTRVKEVKCYDIDTAKNYRLEFFYEEGIATTEPDRFDIPKQGELRKSVYNIDRHAVAPGVGYTRVATESKSIDGQSLGKMVYTFKNFIDPFIGGRQKDIHFGKNYIGGYFSIFLGEINEIVRVFDYFSSSYGKTDQITQFDKEGNVVSGITYEYLTPSQTDQQGKVEEVFHRWLEVVDPDTKKPFNIISSFAKIKYTTALKKITRVHDGITSVTEFNDFDPITGMPRIVTTSDPTSGNMLTVIKPAFRQFISMGPKVMDPVNRNMLTQIFLQQTFRDEQLLNGAVTTWRIHDHPKRVRNSAVYNTVKSQVFGFHTPDETKVYNGEDNIQNWKKIQSVTLYNQDRKPIEIKGIHNHFTSIKYGYNYQFKIAEISNANYRSFAYSGFEDPLDDLFFGGEIGGVVFRTNAHDEGIVSAHSGDHVLKVMPGTAVEVFTSTSEFEIVDGEQIERGLQTGRYYRASTWVRGEDNSNLIVTLDNTAIHTGSTTGVSVNGWKLVVMDFFVPSTTNHLKVEMVASGSTAYFDDFRLHPVDAPMKSYVYDERTGQLLFELDNENFYARYVYDEAGRLVRVFKETESGEKLISKQFYHYAKETN